MRRVDGLYPALAAGLLAASLVLAALYANIADSTFAAREAIFDRLIQQFPRGGPDVNVIAIDIDGESLERIGPWPWRRSTLARLAERLAALEPAAIALDIVLEGEDRIGARAALMGLAASESRPDLAEMAKAFPDEDKAIAALVEKGVPLALGLGAAARPQPQTFPSLLLATAGSEPPRIDPPSAPGIVGPPPAVVDSGPGLGVLSLDVDADGLLRRVPLLVRAQSGDAPGLFAGLALEALRIASGAGAVFLAPDNAAIEIGTTRIPMPADALLRLHPRAPDYWRDRTISAWRVMAGQLPSIPAGAVFVIGSSAPEAGVYLPAADRGARASLQIQTEAIDQMRGGRHIVRPPHAPASEWIAAALGGAGAALAGVSLSPLWLAAAAGAILAMALALAASAFVQAGLLIDILPFAATTLAGALAASLTVHSYIRKNRVRVEARFARYLAPEVVDMLARNPRMLRIAPQRREVTAIFTDLEGFTPFSERTAPEQLIATLDGYFETIAAIAVEHGGMVDKIVGDAIHVFFNMPLDQPDHAERAVRCARAIRAATEAYRSQERQARLGLGRTRIGVDTGPATVGDVGGGGKLDYTAHGEAINRAARLQGMARDYPSGVLIGEGAASRLPSIAGLVKVGEATPRGLSTPQALYTFADLTQGAAHKAAPAQYPPG